MKMKFLDMQFVYLFVCDCDGSIVPRKDVQWYRVYEFVFDRLRAVRQDMVIQRIGGNSAIWILESCVRFLVYAGYRLVHNSILSLSFGSTSVGYLHWTSL